MMTQTLNLLDKTWMLAGKPETVYQPETPTIWPMRRWEEIKAVLTGVENLALWLEPQHEPEEIAEDLSHFQFIALEYPSFKDGRAYSLAVVLRRQLGYDRPLLAFGDVRRDQIEQMNRCGIDYYLAGDGQVCKTADAEKFSHYYQSAVD